MCYVSVQTVCKCNKRAGGMLLDENKSTEYYVLLRWTDNTKQEKQAWSSPGAVIRDFQELCKSF